jgi:hypothetical protein
VLALGSKPNDQLVEQLTDLIGEIHVAGDARQIAHILDATAQAALAAHLI